MRRIIDVAEGSGGEGGCKGIMNDRVSGVRMLKRRAGAAAGLTWDLDGWVATA